MPRGIYIRTEEHRKRIGDKHRNKVVSKETRKRMSESKIKFHRDHPDFQKGENNPMYGKIGENNPNYGKQWSWSKESKEKISGENHPTWKGNDAKKSALHARVRNNKSIPEICDICHQKVDKYGTTKLELSNIKNHQYTDNPDDYQYVHRSCHKIYDIKKEEIK